MNYLILPGYQNSGAQHWQTFWEKKLPNAQRLEQEDWLHPERQKWVANLERKIREIGENTILIAHSLGCLTAAYWAEVTKFRVKGALLVAPPDANRKDFPEAIHGFKQVPKIHFLFPSIVVASTNDPYAKISVAEDLATSWGSEFVVIGDHGHINSASGLGDWPQGFDLLRKLEALV